MSNQSSWQDPDIAHRFLDQRRANIPYAPDQLQMMIHLVRHFLGSPRRVLDLGCGDGILARTILHYWPLTSAVLVDHSQPMIERATEAMRSAGKNVTIRLGELADPMRNVVPETFDLIVSGYAIHHLPTTRKRTLYAEILDLLSPGGLFVHIEHVASATPQGEALFDHLYIENLVSHSQRSYDDVSCEYHARADKADNKLEPLNVQLQWLQEIGFVEVDCYFKWLELAVFAGMKSKE